MFILGVPLGQPRPRARRLGDRVIIYDPKTAEPWRKAVAYAVRECVEFPYEEPLDLTLTFYFPRPKSHYGTGKNSGRIKGSAPKHHAQKIDIDNAIKSTLDAMNMVLYLDDKQVTRVIAQKLWAPRPDQAGLALQAGFSVSPEEPSSHYLTEPHASQS